MKFESLNIDQKVQRAIQDMKYEHCTPVQEQALPESLEGRDIIAQSQTGTGKTAVFLITAIQRMLESDDKGREIRALILVPTRELAVQVDKQAKELCKYIKYDSLPIYGGVGYEEQEKKLSKGVEIVVATPGRLIDFVKSKKVDLSGVKYFIVDEADRMFDMGFMPDVRFILGKAPHKSKRQTMIFSATLDSRVRRLSEQFMRESVVIEIEPDQITVDKVEQHLFHVSKEEKLPLLLTLLSKEDMPKVIIFTNMKRTAERLCFKLKGNGFNAEAITGDIAQSKRLRIIENLKSGKIPILVATDVAARGIHVDGITHVFNYDVPNAAANYVHRIGRTARAGAKGVAYTIACEDFVEHLPEVEDYIEQKIKVDHIDFELLKDKSGPYRPKPRPTDRSAGGGRGVSGSRPPLRRASSGAKGHDSKPFRAGKTRAGSALGRPSGEKRTGASGTVKKGMSQAERMAHYKKKYGGKKF